MHANIDELERIRDAHRDKHAIFEMQLENIEAQCIHLSKEYGDICGQVERIREEKQVYDNRAHEIRQRLSNIDTSYGNASHEKDHYERQKSRYADDYEAALEKLDEEQSELKRQIVACMEHSDRVLVQKPTQEIEEQLLRLNALVLEAENGIGRRDKIAKELSSSIESLAYCKSEVEQAESLIQLIYQSLTKRKAKYKLFQDMITTRAKRLFASHLQKRGYRGMLMVDHVAKTLNLNVDVETIDAETAYDAELSSSANSLSGGEKSYATVCLLLALWHAMYSPFRALDEFDVFMDAANRRLAMKLMLENARSIGGNSQYILITPQSLKNVEGPDVRIIKMKDPERGKGRQTTLPFGASQMDTDE